MAFFAGCGRWDGAFGKRSEKQRWVNHRAAGFVRSEMKLSAFQTGTQGSEENEEEKQMGTKVCHRKWRLRESENGSYGVCFIDKMRLFACCVFIG